LLARAFAAVALAAVALPAGLPVAALLAIAAGAAALRTAAAVLATAAPVVLAAAVHRAAGGVVAARLAPTLPLLLEATAAARFAAASAGRVRTGAFECTAALFVAATRILAASRARSVAILAATLRTALTAVLVVAIPVSLVPLHGDPLQQSSSRGTARGRHSLAVARRATRQQTTGLAACGHDACCTPSLSVGAPLDARHLQEQHR